MPDANLVVWTTDWHLVSADGETSTTGTPTTPTKAGQVVAHINGTYDPIGCIDTGDNKDKYGATLTTEAHDQYISKVQNVLQWLPVNAGADINATFPNLPGNHDEFYDYTDETGDNDFTPYDAKFWGAPYHWTADWDAPRIRFIGCHSYIHHFLTAESPSMAGFFTMDQTEIDWLENELATLPERWQAIVCTHAPIAPSFGNYIRFGGVNLLALLATYNTKIVCCLSGHRHINWGVEATTSVTHICAGGVSYGLGNGYGVFSPIEYDPDARSITFDLRLARYATGFPQFNGFTPFTLQLQPHRLFISRA